jgi:protein-disulfide isomerase
MPSQPRNPAASAPAVPRLGALPTLALILSALGAALSLVTLYIHNRLAADQGDYTSFCDVSAELSCDLVLGSGYASFLGIPVAGWALASYAASALLAFALLRAGAEMLPRIATAFVALTGAMLAISLYFLAISTLVIGVACPMCLSLDAVNVALFATAVAVARIARSATFSPRSPLLVAGALTAAAIVALVVFQGPGDAASGPLTVDRIRREDPRFYAWYVSQPVTEMPLGESAGQSAKATNVDITVVEFSDFECPHCRRAYLDLSEVIASDPGVRVIHRNFPLHPDCNPKVEAKIHVNACGAAVAAECASRLGNGDAYNRVLFSHQDALGRDALVGYAREVGIDGDAFTACLGSPEASAAVAEDVRQGAAAGVESTPTFFINGRIIKGGFPRTAQYRYALAIERERLTKAGTN